jgi:16S rRNA C967 or C1407 C5-methylase (RsmB/RsmF family)
LFFWAKFLVYFFYLSKMEIGKQDTDPESGPENFDQAVDSFFGDFTEFHSFLSSNSIDPRTYLASLKSYCNSGRRYFRVNLQKSITRASLIKNFAGSIQDPEQDLIQLPNPFLRDIYSLPIQTKINTVPAFVNSEIFGIDFSSALVIKSLDPKPNEKILDLCCCPGAKLIYIADIIKSSQNFALGQGSKIVGNDISVDRLGICRNLVGKSGNNDIIELSNQDAVNFEWKNDSFFDRVLVDVECTHDGSFKHIVKFLGGSKNTKKIKKPGPEKKISNNEKKRRLWQKVRNEKTKELGSKYFSAYEKKNEWTKEDFKSRVLDGKKLEVLGHLQEEILYRGFCLVKEDGILVYSTCS